MSLGATTTTATAGGTSIGFHDLTASDQTICSSNVGSGDYALNDLLIQAKSNGSGVVTVTIKFNDDHPAATGTYTGGGLGTAPNQGVAWTGTDEVSGTVSSTITFTKADNASYVQVASPTFANTTTL